MSNDVHDVLKRALDRPQRSTGYLKEEASNDACENDVLAMLAAFPGRAFQPEQIRGLLRKKDHSIEDIEAALIELDRKKLVAMDMVPVATATSVGRKLASMRGQSGRTGRDGHEG